MQSPSSYGLQPWKFLEINDPTLRKQLRPELWNQSQITDCFYRVVFLVQRRSRSPNRKMAAVRGLDAAALVTYRQMIDVDLIDGARSQQIERWASNQVYIALGTFMTAAALLEVDICTSNDLVNLSFECVINLADMPYRSCVMCAAGCRNSSVTFTSPAKVRYTPAELIKRRWFERGGPPCRFAPVFDLVEPEEGQRRGAVSGYEAGLRCCRCRPPCRKGSQIRKL